MKKLKKLFSGNSLLLTSIVLLLLLIVFFGVSYVTETPATIKDLRITNISDTSVTVTYFTEVPTYGSVIVSDKNDFDFFNQLSRTRYYDDRKDGELRYSHHITVSGLKPSSAYFFEVMGNLKNVKYTYPVLQTGKTLDTLVTPDPTYGSFSDNTSMDSIVYLSIDGSTLQSTYLGTGNTFSMDKANIRTPDLEDQAKYKYHDPILIEILSKDTQLGYQTNVGSDQPTAKFETTTNKETSKIKLNTSVLGSVYAEACSAKTLTEGEKTTCTGPNGYQYVVKDGKFSDEIARMQDYYVQTGITGSKDFTEQGKIDAAKGKDQGPFSPTNPAPIPVNANLPLCSNDDKSVKVGEPCRGAENGLTYKRTATGFDDTIAKAQNADKNLLFTKTTVTLEQEALTTAEKAKLEAEHKALCAQLTVNKVVWTKKDDNTLFNCKDGTYIEYKCKEGDVVLPKEVGKDDKCGEINTDIAQKCKDGKTIGDVITEEDKTYIIVGCSGNVSVKIYHGGSEYNSQITKGAKCTQKSNVVGNVLCDIYAHLGKGESCDTNFLFAYNCKSIYKDADKQPPSNIVPAGSQAPKLDTNLEASLKSYCAGNSITECDKLKKLLIENKKDICITADSVQTKPTDIDISIYTSAVCDKDKIAAYDKSYKDKEGYDVVKTIYNYGEYVCQGHYYYYNSNAYSIPILDGCIKKDLINNGVVAPGATGPAKVLLAPAVLSGSYYELNPIDDCNKVVKGNLNTPNKITKTCGCGQIPDTIENGGQLTLNKKDGAVYGCIGREDGGGTIVIKDKLENLSKYEIGVINKTTGSFEIVSTDKPAGTFVASPATNIETKESPKAPTGKTFSKPEVTSKKECTKWSDNTNTCCMEITLTNTQYFTDGSTLDYIKGTVKSECSTKVIIKDVGTSCGAYKENETYCANNGATEFGLAKCIGGKPQVIEGLCDPSKPNKTSMNGLVSPVNAQVVLGVSDSSGVELNSTGTYSITSGNTSIKEFKVMDLVNGKAKIVFFDDKNANGIRDTGEEDITTPVEVKIEKTSDISRFELNEGWNLVGYEYTEARTAKDILSNIASNGGYATHVATYRQGGWVMYSERGEKSFGTNFNLVPGEGYFVKVIKSGKLSFEGNKIAANQPYRLSNGWNLLSFRLDPVLKASKLIDAINLNTPVASDVVTRYVSGKYENVVKDKDTVYGNDFDIEENKGYFVRVTKGGVVIKFVE